MTMLTVTNVDGVLIYNEGHYQNACIMLSLKARMQKQSILVYIQRKNVNMLLRYH